MWTVPRRVCLPAQGSCELERNKVNKKIKSITAYYGWLVRSSGGGGDKSSSAGQ